jgi:hypothetical protein
MNTEDDSDDKPKTDGLISQAYAAIRATLERFIVGLHPAALAPDDFATRTSSPSSEEYALASNAQILERMHRNPSGLLSEQPFIDTLMNVRNAENNRKQTRHLVVGFYCLAFAALVLALRPAPTPQAPPAQTAEQQRGTEQALEVKLGLLKDEFNLKLQSKDMEIKELKRQITLLNQGQAELTKQIKARAKAPPAPANPAPPPANSTRSPRQSRAPAG